MITEKKLDLIILACIVAFAVNSFGQSREGITQVSTEQEISVIITFSNKPDLRKFKKDPKKLRRRKIVQTLKENAHTSQERALEILARKNVTKLRQLWLINALAVTAEPETIQQIQSLPNVESVTQENTFHLPQTTYISQVGPQSDNLTAIGAPQLWDAGYTGQGVVVASMGTGVDLNHPNLINKWRAGTNSWFDVHNQYSFPYDNDGHGTQTMGIMVGGVQSDSHIPMGVAPDANWIAVRIFNNDLVAYTSDIVAGFQWLSNPDGDPNYAPDIVNISWGYSFNSDQCIGYDIIGPAIQALKEADIAVVCAAGDTGLSETPSSLSPANYPETFAVGAVDSSLNLLIDSSRGPSSCNGDIFPNIVAPGISIPTTDISFGGLPVYTTLSKTSAAAPQVSGAMALLLSAFPEASITQIEWALQKTVLDSGDIGPDNDYGYGFIDIAKAYELIAVDLDRDKSIDFTDFIALADQWLKHNCNTPDWCGNADVNRDSDVDEYDLEQLCSHWLE